MAFSARPSRLKAVERLAAFRRGEQEPCFVPQQEAWRGCDRRSHEPGRVGGDEKRAGDSEALARRIIGAGRRSDGRLSAPALIVVTGRSAVGSRRRCSQRAGQPGRPRPPVPRPPRASGYPLSRAARARRASAVPGRRLAHGADVRLPRGGAFGSSSMKNEFASSSRSEEGATLSGSSIPGSARRRARSRTDLTTRKRGNVLQVVIRLRVDVDDEGAAERGLQREQLGRDRLPDPSVPARRMEGACLSAPRAGVEQHRPRAAARGRADVGALARADGLACERHQGAELVDREKSP